MSTKLSSQQLHIHLTFIRDGVPLRVSACSGLTPFDSLLDFYYKNIRNYQVKENQSLTASLWLQLGAKFGLIHPLSPQVELKSSTLLLTTIPSSLRVFLRLMQVTETPVPEHFLQQKERLLPASGSSRPPADQMLLDEFKLCTQLPTNLPVYSRLSCKLSSDD